MTRVELIASSKSFYKLKSRILLDFLDQDALLNSAIVTSLCMQDFLGDDDIEMIVWEGGCNEGSFLGIFQDLITKVLFEKSSELIFKILICYYIDELYCFKIIKTYINWVVDVLVFQTVD